MVLVSSECAGAVAGRAAARPWPSHLPCWSLLGVCCAHTSHMSLTSRATTVLAAVIHSATCGSCPRETQKVVTASAPRPADTKSYLRNIWFSVCSVEARRCSGSCIARTTTEVRRGGLLAAAAAGARPEVAHRWAAFLVQAGSRKLLARVLDMLGNCGWRDLKGPAAGKGAGGQLACRWTVGMLAKQLDRRLPSLTDETPRVKLQVALRSPPAAPARESSAANCQHAPQPLQAAPL